jgi:hypothetical protein
LQAARIREENETEAALDRTRVEQAEIATDRQRVELFGIAMREIYQPLIERGFTKEQASAALTVATRNLKVLDSMSEKGVILDIDKAFDDL